MTAVISLTLIMKLERDTEIDFVDRFYLHWEIQNFPLLFFSKYFFLSYDDAYAVDSEQMVIALYYNVIVVHINYISRAHHSERAKTEQSTKSISYFRENYRYHRQLGKAVAILQRA